MPSDAPRKPPPRASPAPPVWAASSRASPRAGRHPRRTSSLARARRRRDRGARDRACRGAGRAAREAARRGHEGRPSAVHGGLHGAARGGARALQADAGRPARRRPAAAVPRRRAPAGSTSWAIPAAVFAEFEEEAFAAASIGQVHRAVTRDGDAVAVKVQYPGVAEAVETDMRNLTMLLPLVKRLAPGLDVKALYGELRERIAEELDYESRRRASGRSRAPTAAIRSPPCPRSTRGSPAAACSSRTCWRARASSRSSGATRRRATASGRSSSASISASSSTSAGCAATRTRATTCCFPTGAWASSTSASCACSSPATGLRAPCRGRRGGTRSRRRPRRAVRAGVLPDPGAFDPDGLLEQVLGMEGVVPRARRAPAHAGICCDAGTYG